MTSQEILILATRVMMHDDHDHESSVLVEQRSVDLGDLVARDRDVMTPNSSTDASPPTYKNKGQEEQKTVKIMLISYP